MSQRGVPSRWLPAVMAVLALLSGAGAFFLALPISSRLAPGGGATPVTGTSRQVTPFVDGWSPLLVDVPAGGNRLRVRPVDAASLADVPGHTPLDLGHHYSHALGPDGRMLAVIVYPSGSHNRGGVLHLIDRDTWTDAPTAVVLDDSVYAPAFAPDGQALYWATPSRHDRAHDMPRAFALYRYRLPDGTLSVVAQFPPSFVPSDIRPSPNGTRLAIFGVPTDAGNLTEDAPHVVLVDLDAGGIAADLRLDGVKAGQVRQGPDWGPEYPYRVYRPGLAWDLPRQRLYVVHPDEDRVTVVDLARGHVLAPTDIHPRASLLDRLLTWLVPGAAAKSVPMTSRWAVLGGDGSRLYFVGSHDTGTRQPDGTWRWRSVAEPLRVIDTQDLAEVQRLDASRGLPVLLPGGRRLLVQAPGGLAVLDEEGLVEVASVALQDDFHPRGVSPDGRYVYLGRTATQQDRQVVTFRVLDLSTGAVTAERTVDGYGDLLLIPGET